MARTACACPALSTLTFGAAWPACRPCSLVRGRVRIRVRATQSQRAELGRPNTLYVKPYRHRGLLQAFNVCGDRELPVSVCTVSLVGNGITHPSLNPASLSIDRLLLLYLGGGGPSLAQQGSIAPTHRCSTRVTG